MKLPKPIDKFLYYWGLICIYTGALAVLVLGLYFIQYKQFPAGFEPLNTPLMIFGFGYLFFEVLIRFIVKLWIYSKEGVKK